MDVHDALRDLSEEDLIRRLGRDRREGRDTAHDPDAIGESEPGGIGSARRLAPPPLPQNPNGTRRSRCVAKSTVSGEKFTAQGLSQCDIGSVVGSQIVPKFVGSPHQWKRRITNNRHCLEVGYCAGKSSCRDGPADPALSQDRHCFHVDQIRCSDVISTSELGSSEIPIVPIIAYDVGEDRCVDDDQLRERSLAMSSAACFRPTRPPLRRSMRAKSSSVVGRAARRVSSPARYCCRDCPWRSARRWSVA